MNKDTTKRVVKFEIKITQNYVQLLLWLIYKGVCCCFFLSHFSVIIKLSSPSELGSIIVLTLHTGTDISGTFSDLL